MTAIADAFILSGVRTPRGKGSPRGALHAVPPIRLAGALLDVLGPKVGTAVDDVILGCATQVDDQGANLARTALLAAGWDARVPGGTIALGHAYGATGAILLLAAVDELARRNERYAVVAVSGAAGLGVATLLERL